MRIIAPRRGRRISGESPPRITFLLAVSDHNHPRIRHRRPGRRIRHENRKLRRTRPQIIIHRHHPNIVRPPIPHLIPIRTLRPRRLRQQQPRRQSQRQNRPRQRNPTQENPRRRRKNHFRPPYNPGISITRPSNHPTRDRASKWLR